MADVHTLSGAYALDALGPEEAAVFREHLEGCAACRQEVRELREAAARMGAVETVRPPADLRARVLAAADRTPQQPPVPRAEDRSSVTPLAAREQRRPRRGRWERLAVAAAAVLLVGAGAVGLSRVLGGSEQLSPYQRVVQADDARTVGEPTMNGGEIAVAVSPSQHRMAVDTSGLPALRGGRVYQLWTIHGKADIVSIAVIAKPGDTAAMKIPPRGTTVALTIEPAGGSEQPTKAPIVQLEPAAV